MSYRVEIYDPEHEFFGFHILEEILIFLNNPLLSIDIYLETSVFEES